jgi:hypothetical protein
VEGPFVASNAAQHIDLCPLCSKRVDPNVFSVNTFFWKIRVTRVQQKIFHREFSLPAKHFRPVGRCGSRLRINYAIDYIPKLY